MLAAGLSFFNDVNSLKRCLDSLWGFDVILAIDGRYEGYPSESNLSTDGSRELCTQYPNVVLIDKPDLKEYEKRDAYLRYQGISQLVIIDSDEWLEGEFTEMPAETGVYSVEFVNADRQHYPTPRLIINPNEFQYYGAHCVVKRGNSIFRLKGERLVQGITIRADDSLRKPEYEQAWQKYREVQSHLERAVKDRYS